MTRPRGHAVVVACLGVAACGSKTIGRTTPAADAGPDGLVSTLPGQDPRACGAEGTIYPAQPALDIFFLLDASYSIRGSLQDGPIEANRWQSVGDAIEYFLADRRLVGMGAGLQYYPYINTASCLAAADCGRYGPCVQRRVCSDEGTPSKPFRFFCHSDSECSPGAACLPRGLCGNSEASCLTFGQACAGDLGTCALEAGTCTGASRRQCETDDYTVPAVGVAALPAGAPAIVSSLHARRPAGLQTIDAAINGTNAYLRGRTTTNRGHRPVRVLIAAGSPAACDPDNPIAIVDALGAGRMTEILTYVVGVLPTIGDLEAIKVELDRWAVAGGTKGSFAMKPDIELTDNFFDALGQIVADLPCEYEIPVVVGGAGVNYGQIDLSYQLSGRPETIVARVENEAACQTGASGWYYRADATTHMPTRIVACPATCQAIKQDSHATVAVRYNCSKPEPGPSIQ